MPYTTVTLRHDVARKLRAAKNPGESYGDLLGRLIDNQPAKCVEEWLKSLAPLEGRGAFMAEDRERLRADQASPRGSSSRRKRHAPV